MIITFSRNIKYYKYDFIFDATSMLPHFGGGRAFSERAFHYLHATPSKSLLLV